MLVRSKEGIETPLFIYRLIMIQDNIEFYYGFPLVNSDGRPYHKEFQDILDRPEEYKDFTGLELTCLGYLVGTDREHFNDSFMEFGHYYHRPRVNDFKTEVITSLTTAIQDLEAREEEEGMDKYLGERRALLELYTHLRNSKPQVFIIQKEKE